jgi:pantoate--beta-alanine ligase
VNPTQFGQDEDLDKYPRDFEKDRNILEKYDCDLLFFPSTKEMYPSSKPGETFVVPGRTAEGLEGALRPGHFRGVATVVTKLLNIVNPTTTYLGQKDGQQVAVIKKLVEDLNFTTNITVVPTVREEDGLAFSSRNSYLSKGNRKKAPVLYSSLLIASSEYKNGDHSAQHLKEMIREQLKMDSEITIDYISIAESNSLQEVEKASPGCMISAAIWLGNTRLIDNIVLE